MLLFLQLTVAAYACNAPQADSDNMMVAASGSAAAAQPCDGMNKQSSSKLCEQHCLQASQSVDTQPHTGIASPVLSLMTIVIAIDERMPPAINMQRALLAPVVDPPPLVRFGVLRI